MQELITGLYDFDETDGTYLIKISPGRYLDLFNNLDSYPIRKRDIHQDIINYIEDCSVDIPLNNKIKIQITIRDEPYREDLEERTRKGIHNYLLYELALHQKSSRKELMTSGMYALTFLVLTACTFLFEKSGFEPKSFFFQTGMQGLSIGSWVFLWEAIAGIFIKNQRHRFLIRTYRRLISTSVEFKYRQSSSSGDFTSAGLSFAGVPCSQDQPHGAPQHSAGGTGYAVNHGGADTPAAFTSGLRGLAAGAGEYQGRKKKHAKQGRFSEGRRRGTRGSSSNNVRQK